MTMAYDMKWHIERRVIECVITGEITMDDMMGIRQEYMQDYLEQNTESAVHFLFDMSQMVEPGFSTNDLFEASATMHDAPSGWRLYFGKEMVTFRFTVTVYHESRGQRSRWFATREAALKFLCAEDASLGC
jgi:hypothetical protein